MSVWPAKEKHFCLALTGKLKKKVSKLLRTNGLLYIFYLNSFIVLVGSSILSIVEEKSFSDSLWWALVTVTTVGYGDIVPTSIFGKWLAVLLMLVGIETIGMLTSALTNFFVKDNPDEQKKLDKLQDELITQRILVEKQSEKIEELHRMIQDLLEKNSFGHTKTTRRVVQIEDKVLGSQVSKGFSFCKVV